MSLIFLREFLRHPGQIGAIAPSSEALAREIVSGVGVETAEVVLEYGPGTGAFTGEILRNLPRGGRLIAIEQSPELAASLRGRYPQTDVHNGSVADVADVLGERGLQQADCVICGLPWAAFGAERQDRLMSAMLDVLRPGGWFTTFAYLQGLLLPAARRFRRRLGEWFAEVQTSPTVWRNLPPAFVYRCLRG